ncbi:MAG: TIGR02444 family protein [Proteobacteria bacterium]|nr:TIGR02444 family protein [Pseudomonadota bacterium]
MDFPDHPFWDWSLDIYGRPGVEKILLDLQNRHGLDVNLLLFACWTGATGRGRLVDEDWRRLADGTVDWRANVVEPLRAIRRHLKGRDEMPGAAAMHEKVKALELEAEHAAQLSIAGLAPKQRELAVGTAVRIADASANLGDCIAAVGLSLSGGDQDLLTSLAQTACSGPQTR